MYNNKKEEGERSPQARSRLRSLVQNKFGPLVRSSIPISSHKYVAVLTMKFIYGVHDAIMRIAFVSQDYVRS